MAPKRELFVAVDASGQAPPPEKRPRAEPAPGSNTTEPPPPPKHFLAIVLVVLFLKRPKGRTNRDNLATSPSLISCMATELGHVRQSLNTLIREQKIVKQWVQVLSQKVDTLTQSSAKHHNHNRPIRQDANQEDTSSKPEGLATAEGKGENTSIQLRFISRMKTHVYHDDEIKSESNSAIKIGIYNGDRMIESGGLSNVQVEIFALDGDFPHASPKSWTAKKFNKHRAISRDGSGNVLAGEGTKAQLKNGQCDLGCIKFTEGSCKARGGKFIIGARVCEGKVSGLHVQGAVMNPVVVQDRRNKANEKNHPPILNASVRRLEEIAKVYADRLEKEKIFTVEHFLKAFNEDPCKLAKILKVNMESKAWKNMTKHANECSLEGRHKLKLFICTEKSVKLFFNCVHYLVGAEFFGGPYILSDKFSSAQQELVDQLKEGAYAKLDALSEDHVMTDSSPNPIHVDKYTIGAGPSYMPGEPPNSSTSIERIAAAERLSHPRIDPAHSSFIPDYDRMHNNQGACFSPAIVSFSAESSVRRSSDAHSGGIPIPPLESSSHAQHIELSCANAIHNDPGSSSSIADHLYTHNYPADPDALGGWQFLSHQDVQLAILQQQAGTHGYVTPGLNDAVIQSQLFWSGSGNGNLDASTSAHISIPLPPHELLNAGTPRSAQWSTQSEMQATLAQSNDASVASSSAQHALPPPWYP